MLRPLILAPILALLIGGPADASSPAAMQAGIAEAARACRKASTLKNARINGAPVLFSDASGKTAMLVSGRWRPAHMKNARATMLCLYDRKGQAAETQEWRF